MPEIQKFDLGPTFDIPSVEVFATGTWNGDIYTERDLDEMVHAFEETKDKLKPYLKLGHDNNQKLLQKDGYPAAGYVSRLYRAGTKLMADFVSIPKAIYELMKVGAYKKRSAEIYVDIPIVGKTYKYLLKAVALLGADTPAVQSLKDILALYASAKPAEAYNEDSPARLYELEIPESKEDVMSQELTQQLAEANKKFAEAQVKIQELEGLTSKVKELSEQASASVARVAELEKENGEFKAQAKKFSDEKNKAEVSSILDKLVQEKKISPAQKEFAFALLMDARERGERKFKIGEKEITNEELVLNFFQNNVAGLPTQEQSVQGEPHGKAGDEAKADLVARQAHEWMEKNPGKTYREALEAISPEGIPLTGPAKAE